MREMTTEEAELFAPVVQHERIEPGITPCQRNATAAQGVSKSMLDTKENAAPFAIVAGMG
jgi:hypothetical protein